MTTQKPKSWTLSDPIDFTAPEALSADLEAIFDGDASVSAVAFLWCSGYSDGKDFYGNHGWIEHWRQDPLTKREIAERNPAYAARAWAFDDHYQTLCAPIAKARDGNQSMLIALRCGAFFLFDDRDIHDEATFHLANDGGLSPDGVIAGVHPAFLKDTGTGHDLLQAKGIFEDYFTEIATAAAVILQMRSIPEENAEGGDIDGD